MTPNRYIRFTAGRIYKAAQSDGEHLVWIDGGRVQFALSCSRAAYRAFRRVPLERIIGTFDEHATLCSLCEVLEYSIEQQGESKWPIQSTSPTTTKNR